MQSREYSGRCELENRAEIIGTTRDGNSIEIAIGVLHQRRDYLRAGFLKGTELLVRNASPQIHRRGCDQRHRKSQMPPSALGREEARLPGKGRVG